MQNLCRKVVSDDCQTKCGEYSSGCRTCFLEVSNDARDVEESEKLMSEFSDGGQLGERPEEKILRDPFPFF